MPENRNKTCPVRTLTVRNFSVIKEAKLEFGKITVLIGPPSSGKSLLCKLAYFLGGEIVAIAVESLISQSRWEEFLESASREFNSRFSTEGWLSTSSTARFSSQDFSAEVFGADDPLNPKIEIRFSGAFQELYATLRKNISEQPASMNPALSELRQELWVKLGLSLNKTRTQANVYIPSGRAFFTDLGKSVSALQNPSLDQITRRFAGQIAWDTRWKIGLLTAGRDVVPEIEREMHRIVGGVVIVSDGKPHFLSSDGRRLPLSLQSSGTQELLPMFSVVNYLAYHQEHYNARAAAMKISPMADIIDHSPFIYLEEPEVHIFPKTQYELVKLFAWLANDPILSFDWVITTHSPYILSSFNNLIFAGQLGQDKRLKKRIKIDERYWVEPGTFRAYSIHDGKSESILSDSGLIDGDYLDSVSETIGNGFDELLRLEYGKKKAS